VVQAQTLAVFKPDLAAAAAAVVLVFLMQVLTLVVLVLLAHLVMQHFMGTQVVQGKTYLVITTAAVAVVQVALVLAR
jgi:hypothetical protein